MSTELLLHRHSGAATAARRTGVRSFPLLAAALVTFLPAAVAAARPEPTDAELNEARELFGAGRRLEDESRWREALELFQRIAEVKSTPQVRFHVALCMENLGQWTLALDGFGDAANEARGVAVDVVTEAEEHIHQLETLLPTVSLQVTGAAAGDVLLLDQRPIPLDPGPVARRVDPGSHLAELRRDDTPIAHASFTLEPRSALRVELHVGDVAAPIAAPLVAVAPDAGASPSSEHAVHAIGWAAVGVAGASAITSGVFGVLRGAALGRLDDACPTRTQCPPSVASIVGEGKTDATLVDVFGVLAGAAATTGVLLLVIPPARPAEKPSGAAAASRFSLAFTGAGVVGKGSF